jgi:hypothetical protein
MCVINDVCRLMGCARIITLITLNHPLLSPSRPFSSATRKCNRSGTPQKQIMVSIHSTRKLSLLSRFVIERLPIILLYAHTCEGFDEHLAGQYSFLFLGRVHRKRASFVCQWTPTWHNCRYHPMQSTPLVPVFSTPCALRGVGTRDM